MECARDIRRFSMSRLARFAIPVAVLACALGGFGQQRKRSGASKQPEAAPPTQPSAPLQAIRNNNIGLALMDRQQFSEALGKFQTACIMDPQSDIACLNTGIALLNMQQFDEAKKVLTKSSERDPKNPGAWFNLGLVEKTAGRPQIAINDFQKVAALDPNDADTQYFLGQVYSEQQQYPMAIAAFEKAVKLDPFSRLGRTRSRPKRRSTPTISIAPWLISIASGRSLRRTWVGPSAMHTGSRENIPALRNCRAIPSRCCRPRKFALPMSQRTPGCPCRRSRPPAAFARVVIRKVPVQTVKKARGRGPLLWRLASRARSPAFSAAARVHVFDFDGDGKPDIFLVNADGKGNAALYRNNGNGKFVNVTKAAGLEFQGEGTGCAVGDYDNDHHPDLSVSSNIGVTLYHATRATGRLRMLPMLPESAPKASCSG